MAEQKRTQRIPNKNLNRFDAMESQATGRGTSLDKLSQLNPAVSLFTPQTSRLWYLANGFIQNVIDAPAEDATREWITIKTNRDKDLNISRLLENRMTELNVRQKICDLIRFSRLYNNGGFLYYGVTADKPQGTAEIQEPIPSQILKLEYLNVFGPDFVSINDSNVDPLSSGFHKPEFSISGSTVHRSRLSWMVHSYIPEDRRGVSVTETILDAIKAQDTALWSVNSLLDEMDIKIFKSHDIENNDPKKTAEFLAKMRAVLSTQSAVALTPDESLERLQSGGIADSGLKQLFDFVFENLSGLARIPKSRLMGQSQGVITAGQFDLLSYYDSIAKFQELEVRPIIEKLLTILIHESRGEVSQKLGGQVDQLDWEFEFNPLWRIGPVEQADIELKQAQRDQIYITQGVTSPSEIRKDRFRALEEFSKWEDQNIDLTSPSLPDADTIETNSTGLLAQ